MTNVRRGWSEGPGYWRCVYLLKQGEDFRVRRTKEGVEKLFGDSSDNSDLQVSDTLQFAWELIYVHGDINLSRAKCEIDHEDYA